jgi:subtilase family serine protease
MNRRLNLLMVAVATVVGTLGLAATAVTAAGASTASTAVVNGTASPAAAKTPTTGSVPALTPISFEVSLNLRDPAGAAALAQAVSTPGSPQYHAYLSPAQWESQYSPTDTQVAQVTTWLRQRGLTVGAVSSDRLRIDVAGTAAEIEQAFSVTLSYHVVDGRTLRLLDNDLTVPGSLAGIVGGAPGLSETVATPNVDSGASTGVSPSTTIPNDDTTPSVSGGGPSPYPPPSGFVPAPPCGTYYGEKTETTLPPFGGGYPATPPYAVCGYSPGQFRSAYGVAGQVAAGKSGQGVTVAIVDAYASPTLLSDVQQYVRASDPSHPLNSSQFTALYPAFYNHATLCQANTWYTEQTIDVTAVHAVAPGANILYVAGANCLNGLLSALGKVVDGHLAQVVTDSWGDNAGDLLDSPATKNSFDDVFLLAAGTGVSVLFSSGDNGDEFSTYGMTSADYPPSSPWDTAIGGTSVQIGAQGQRLGELGWSTYRSYLCTVVLFGVPGCSKATKNTWLPLTADGGAGGGTSYVYTQPYYQAGVVPSSLALENAPLTGKHLMRVVPDISMDADPATGILMGQTQTFPNGTYWATTRYGGTSLASPLFAGVVALADQASGTALGFLNPALYKLSTSTPSAIHDVVPGGKQSQARVDYANLFDNSAGLLYSYRILTYEGVETYCNGSGNCASRDNTLVTSPGYDNMTGLGTPGTNFVSALAKM